MSTVIKLKVINLTVCATVIVYQQPGTRAPVVRGNRPRVKSGRTTSKRRIQSANTKMLLCG